MEERAARIKDRMDMLKGERLLVHFGNIRCEGRTGMTPRPSGKAAEDQGEKFEDEKSRRLSAATLRFGKKSSSTKNTTETSEN